MGRWADERCARFVRDRTGQERRISAGSGCGRGYEKLMIRSRWACAMVRFHFRGATWRTIWAARISQRWTRARPKAMLAPSASESWGAVAPWGRGGVTWTWCDATAARDEFIASLPQ